MMDFGINELYAKAAVSERARDAATAYRLAQARSGKRGFRATLAQRLAHLAVHLDGETTIQLVGRHMTTAGRQS